jgi:hypothetical protein
VLPKDAWRALFNGECSSSLIKSGSAFTVVERESRNKTTDPIKMLTISVSKSWSLSKNHPITMVMTAEATLPHCL